MGVVRIARGGARLPGAGRNLERGRRDARHHRIVGFALLIGGFVEIIGAFTRGSSLGSRILHIILGILYIIVGFDLIADPLAGTITLTLVVGIMLVIDGAIRLWAAVTSDLPHRWWIALAGVISILFGIWLWTNIPISALAIGVYVGVMLLMAGFTWIMAGWMGRPSTSASAA